MSNMQMTQRINYLTVLDDITGITAHVNLNTTLAMRNYNVARNYNFYLEAAYPIISNKLSITCDGDIHDQISSHGLKSEDIKLVPQMIREILGKFGREWVKF